MKTKAKYRFLLILITVLVAMSYQLKTNDPDLVSTKPTETLHSETDPDKTLLIGEWSKRGNPFLIKITDVRENGRLEVTFYDPSSPSKIEIEMANWTKIGTLLSVYIEIQDPQDHGPSFKLNYIPERDVLVGDYFEPATGMSYPLELNRIK